MILNDIKPLVSTASNRPLRADKMHFCFQASNGTVIAKNNIHVEDFSLCKFCQKKSFETTILAFLIYMH